MVRASLGEINQADCACFRFDQDVLRIEITMNGGYFYIATFV
jgi:hypothetical protein